MSNRHEPEDILPSVIYTPRQHEVLQEVIDNIAALKATGEMKFYCKAADAFQLLGNYVIEECDGAATRTTQ
jgi:hypothetical protein